MLIYAAVPDVRMLEQGFYYAEAEGLRAHPGVAEVRMTNLLADVRQGDFDGLISFFYSHSAVAVLLARLRGRPVVATGGGEQLFPDLAGGKLRYAARIGAFRATAALADRILATSRSDLDRMRATAWLGRARLMLSPHGAAAVEQRDGLPSFATRPEGSFVTICGLDTRLNVERKGIPEALRLLARARMQCSAARLTIIGRDSCRELVARLAEELGVANRVVFAGYVSETEKIALLRAHRYYLQLSVYEGFGIGALEALSQGCQVIHSGAGGLSDTVGAFGVVVDPAWIGRFSIGSLPPYGADQNGTLGAHLKRFRPATRAATIMRALFHEPPPAPDGHQSA